MSAEIDALHGEYRRKRAEFLSAEKEIREVYRRLIGAAEAIRRRYDDRVLVGEGPVAFPTSLARTQDLPERSEVMSLLRKWEAAREAVREAYAAIPASERSDAMPLPNGAQPFH